MEMDADGVSLESFPVRRLVGAINDWVRAIDASQHDAALAAADQVKVFGELLAGRFEFQALLAAVAGSAGIADPAVIVTATCSLLRTIATIVPSQADLT